MSSKLKKFFENEGFEFGDTNNTVDFSDKRTKPHHNSLNKKISKFSSKSTNLLIINGANITESDFGVSKEIYSFDNSDNFDEMKDNSDCE